MDFEGDYFPYGKVLREFSSTPKEKYLTTHHERDQETGLDYRGARLYDSDLGRFLSLDPLAMEFPSWSDYCYVMANPVNFIDPDGRSPEKGKHIKRDDGSYMGFLLLNTPKRTDDQATVDAQAIEIMESLQRSQGVEISAYAISDADGNEGIFINDWSKNTQGSSQDLPEVKYGKNGNSITIEGIEYSIKAQIHTHPDHEGDVNQNIPSYGDSHYAQDNKIPTYIIGPDFISKVVSYKDYYYKFNNIDENGSLGTPEPQSVIADKFKVATKKEVESGEFRFINDN